MQLQVKNRCYDCEDYEIISRKDKVDSISSKNDRYLAESAGSIKRLDKEDTNQKPRRSILKRTQTSTAMTKKPPLLGEIDTCNDDEFKSYINHQQE